MSHETAQIDWLLAAIGEFIVGSYRMRPIFWIALAVLAVATACSLIARKRAIVAGKRAVLAAEGQASKSVA
jgi:hypothetical protein